MGILLHIFYKAARPENVEFTRIKNLNKDQYRCIFISIIMILRLEYNTAQRDIEILITCPGKNKTVDRIVSLINSVDRQIECYSDDNIKLVNVSDIYYIESVDGKTIVCCEKEKYLVKSRLYQIYEKLKDNGFIQISKYCILNINKMDKFKPLDNYRLEAILSNGIYLCITRKYIAGLKQVLRRDE